MQNKESNSPYLKQHNDVCLIAGSAWCLHEDLEKAWSIYPNSPVMAVNDACKIVKAFALFSYHPQRFNEYPYLWKEKQRKFGDDFTVHGSKFIENMPFVDHWWEAARGGGTSSWGAMKVAKLMGFEKVIFCGCPLSPGNYFGYQPGKLMAQKKVIYRYRREIEADSKWHEGVYSMSGWTKEFFGSC